MNYLTERLPKPNYVPIRYRSYFQRKDHDPPHKIYGSSMQELPQFSKSLNKSRLNLQQNSSVTMLSPRKSISPQRNEKSSHFANPEWLPRISNKKSYQLCWFAHFCFIGIKIINSRMAQYYSMTLVWSTYCKFIFNEYSCLYQDGQLKAP